MDKPSFIQHVVIRFSHEPDKVEEIIARAEKLWAALEAHGYGAAAEAVSNRDFPQPEPRPAPVSPQSSAGWDGLPLECKTAAIGFRPAYQLVKSVQARPEPSQQELLSDYAHFDKYLRIKPGNKDIIFNITNIAFKLGIADPIPSHEDIAA